MARPHDARGWWGWKQETRSFPSIAVSRANGDLTPSAAHGGHVLSASGEGKTAAVSCCAGIAVCLSPPGTGGVSPRSGDGVGPSPFHRLRVPEPGMRAVSKLDAWRGYLLLPFLWMRGSPRVSRHKWRDHMMREGGGVGNKRRDHFRQSPLAVPLPAREGWPSRVVGGARRGRAVQGAERGDGKREDTDKPGTGAQFATETGVDTDEQTSIRHPTRGSSRCHGCGRGSRGCSRLLWSR